MRIEDHVAGCNLDDVESAAIVDLERRYSGDIFSSWCGLFGWRAHARGRVMDPHKEGGGRCCEDVLTMSTRVCRVLYCILCIDWCVH